VRFRRSAKRLPEAFHFRQPWRIAMKVDELVKAAQVAAANGTMTQEELSQILADCRQLIKLRNQVEELEFSNSALKREKIRLSTQKEQLISEARDAGIDVSDIDTDQGDDHSGDSGYSEVPVGI
jgi:hypothetical protein